MKPFKADLHIHTCLSPCADLMMTPKAIVREAQAKDIDIIGICDHNSGENVAAVKKAASKYGMTVLGGMEICSREEAHILALFDNEASLEKTQEIIWERLSGENDPTAFGEQVIADEEGRVLGINHKLLTGAVDLAVGEIVDLVHRYRGLAIASHIDKEAFSIISQLGFIPEGLGLDALEVSGNYKLHPFNYDSYRLPFITSSDAHFLHDVGKIYTKFLLEAAEFSEISMALKGISNRAIDFYPN